MKRRLLLFFALFCVSVGTWAAITISSTSVSVGGTTYQGYGIYGAKAGELALLLSGDNSVTVQWNGATLDQLKSAEYIKLGDSQNPNVLKDEDLEALELLSGVKFLDIDGSTLAAGAKISNIKAGSAIEAVTLPGGLSKTDVNAAGAALTACNANFGSCLSLDAEMEERQVNINTYIDPCTSEEVEYTGTVTDGQGYIGDITRPLTFTGSSFTYINTKFKTDSEPDGELSTCSEDQVVNGYVVPNPLKVGLTAKNLYTYNGNNYDPSDQSNVAWWLNSQGVVTNSGNPLGLDVGTQLEVGGSTYSYTFFSGGWEQTFTFDGEVKGNATDGYYGMVENIYQANSQGYQFQVTSSYNYTYIDKNCNVATISSESPQETKDVTYNITVDIETTTITVNVPKEGGDCDVIAYVNTPGSLYKAVSLDANDVVSATGLVISGKINNGDISVHEGAGDPLGNQDQTDHFENSATPAFYLKWESAPIKSVDMSDAVIEDYKYLRVLNAYVDKLESVVFPKTLTKIPNYCCYCGGDNGNKNLSEVVFPTESTSFTIGDYAFHQIAIKNLILPSTVTRVGDYAFERCPKLYSVEMEGLKGECTFGNYVFHACPALQHVSLSEGVQNIGDYMFKQCVVLESIRIPSTCKTIGSFAFQFCYDIHQVTIPEGVELIKYSAFEGAGLTDLYIMATSIDKIPKIYAMEPINGAGPSTFSYQRTTGNNTIPDYHKDDLPYADYDEVMTWYQEEQSGPQGLGSENCLTALHYPESMKPFYEAIDVTKFYTAEQLATIPFSQNPDAQQTGVKKYYTPTEYIAMSTDPTTLTAIVNNVMQEGYEDRGTTPDFGTDEEGNSLYQYLPQSYSVDPRQDGSTTKLFGPDKDGRYYPSQTSYQLRMAAGATSTLAGGVAGEEIASAWGWRQFPLSSSIESIGEIPFEKEYDDTWYTMAFPWRMIDNQLFAAFNQKLEIVEFMGAELLPIEGSDTDFNLVFHFDKVAKTYYMDPENNFYKRELETIRTITSGDVTINKKFYIYTLLDGKDGNETSIVIKDVWPYDVTTASVEQREQHAKYLSIENIMVLPGHPYMIHPAIGAAPGNPTKVYINGVKKVEVGEGKEFATLAAVAESEKVARVVTSNEAGGTSTEAWVNPVTGGGGTYTFIGNINDAVETDGVSDNGVQDMPTEDGPVYFLGVKSGTYYPQYFRKAKGKGKGKWSQYSAIIVPDADAIANVEGGMTVGSSDAPAKGYDVVFGEWEVVEPETVTTAIESAIAEEKESGKPAQIVHMNVVYNINGQVVRTDSTSVEGLPKGLYIVNGKKYMVK